jgi:phosphoribosylformylglycinamidine cyclo-ligase
MKSIVRGCEIAEISLSGGETAELPDMYGETDFDLAGFAVGIAEKQSLLPQLERLNEGDHIYGLPSSGVHSNGFSLLRKASLTTDVLRETLIPTTIYTREMRVLSSSGLIHSAAHITGGGLIGNIQRVLPDHLQPMITWDWKLPDVFRLIQESSEIETAELRRVFNMGVGIAVICSQEHSDRILSLTNTEDIDMFRIGTVVRR